MSKKEKIDTKFSILVTCIHKEEYSFKQAKEENKLIGKIAALLDDEGYTYVLAEDVVIKK